METKDAFLVTDAASTIPCYLPNPRSAARVGAPEEHIVGPGAAGQNQGQIAAGPEPSVMVATDTSANVNNGTAACPSEDLVVAFTYSRRDHSKALEQTREMKFLFGAHMLLVVLYFGKRLPEILSGNSALGSFLEYAAPAAAFIMPFIFFQLMKRLHHVGHDDDMSHHFRFSEEGFALSAEVPLTPWGLMDKVTEVKSAFLLKDSVSNHPVYLPKKALTTSELERLRRLVRDAFTSRPAKAKLRSDEGRILAGDKR